MKYCKMDDLMMAIVGDKLFMYMPGEQPKYGNLANNPAYEAIFNLQPPITREEFERNMPCNGIMEGIFNALYFSAIATNHLK